MLLATWLSGFLLSLSLCLDIGIVNIAIIDASSQRGMLKGFLVGLGSCFGDISYAAASAFGLAWLLQYPLVRWIVWLGGSSLLLVLAMHMLLLALRDRSTKLVHGSLSDDSADHWSLFRRGLLLALASPSSLVWFAAAGAGLIAQATAGDVSRISVFLAGFFIAGMVWSASIAWLAGRGSALLGRRWRETCHLLSAMLFLLFAGKVGLDGYHTLFLAANG